MKTRMYVYVPLLAGPIMSIGPGWVAWYLLYTPNYPSLLSAYAGLYVSIRHSYSPYRGMLRFFAALEDWAKLVNWNLNGISSSLNLIPRSPAEAERSPHSGHKFEH